MTQSQEQAFVLRTRIYRGEWTPALEDSLSRASWDQCRTVAGLRPQDVT